MIVSLRFFQKMFFIRYTGLQLQMQIGGQSTFRCRSVKSRLYIWTWYRWTARYRLMVNG